MGSMNTSYCPLPSRKEELTTLLALLGKGHQQEGLRQFILILIILLIRKKTSSEKCASKGLANCFYLTSSGLGKLVCVRRETLTPPPETQNSFIE